MHCYFNINNTTWQRWSIQFLWIIYYFNNKKTIIYFYPDYYPDKLDNYYFNKDRCNFYLHNGVLDTWSNFNFSLLVKNIRISSKVTDIFKYARNSKEKRKRALLFAWILVGYGDSPAQSKSSAWNSAKPEMWLYEEKNP